MPLPYTPPSKRERSRWMTFAEVVRHIQASVECEEETAVSELRVVMGQGLVPARWAFDRSRESTLFEPPPIFSLDPVPADPFYWTLVLIFMDEDGAVVDQSYWGEATTTPQRRGLFLLRSRVLELWYPSSRNAAAHKLSEPKGLQHWYPSNPSHADQKLSKPKNPSIEQIREEARKLYPEGEFGPNEDQAERLIRKALGKAPRELVRVVLKDPKFRRRPRGNQARI